MTTILVTGAAGFAGYTLSAKLASRGFRVLGLDNLSFGKNLHRRDKRIVNIRMDILDNKKLREVMRKYSPEAVVHLAALHFIPYCNAHPQETLRVNVEGTQSLLEACRESSIKKVLSASTAAVYGQNGSKNRETDTLGPIDIYGHAKFFCEHLLRQYALESGIVGINMRFFNIYGPYENHPHLIPRVMEQYALKNTSIDLGNLSPRRDYVHVDDVADAVITLMEKAVVSDDFNIGTGQEFSVVEVVEMLNRIAGRKVKIRSLAKFRRKVDREHLVADISKIYKIVGWKPKVDMVSGLRDTAAHYGIV